MLYLPDRTQLEYGAEGVMPATTQLYGICRQRGFCGSDCGLCAHIAMGVDHPDRKAAGVARGRKMANARYSKYNPHKLTLCDVCWIFHGPGYCPKT